MFLWCVQTSTNGIEDSRIYEGIKISLILSRKLQDEINWQFIQVMISKILKIFVWQSKAKKQRSAW